MILGPVAEANIDVDVIIQNVSHDGRTDFSFTVHRNDYARTMDLLKTKRAAGHWREGPVWSATRRFARSASSALACVRTSAWRARMFSVLSEEGINIQMITTSEIKTSVVIDEKYMELAVRALHKAFDLEQAAV